MSEDEKLHPLPEAIELETGREVHLTTAQKWCRKGRHGYYLKFRQFGSRMMTSRLCVRDFIDDCTAAVAPKPVNTSKSSRERHREVETARQKLDDLLG
jgi:hypothetical protein